MDENSYRPHDDQLLMSPDALADSVGVSRAFVHVVLDAGCPTYSGLLSLHEFFDWLGEHAERVRYIAGLPDLPSLPVHAGESVWDFQRKRALITLLEFMESRACSESTRRTCAEGVRLLLDGGRCGD